MAKREKVRAFFPHGIPPLPREQFELDRSEVAELEILLGVRLGRQRLKLSSAMYGFGQAVALQDLAYYRQRILGYFREVFTSASKLTILLQMPPNSSEKHKNFDPERYRDIYPYVAGELYWSLCEPDCIGLKDLTDGVDLLARLARGAIEEYSYSETKQVLPADHSLHAFLAELITITKSLMVRRGLVLPKNEDRDDHNSTLLSFIRRAMKWSLAKAKLSVSASSLKPAQKKAALLRLDKYRVMDSTLISYARPIIRQIKKGEHISGMPRLGLPPGLA